MAASTFAAMKIDLTIAEAGVLEKVARAATVLGLESYLVGGFVRDKIIGRETKDLDFVCVGDAIEWAKEVSKLFYPEPRVDYYKNFGTAHIRLQNELDLEFVGARKESYRADSRKPEVEGGSIRDDQERRDFSINALAISLNENNYGDLVDPFDGLGDIGKKIIRTPLGPEHSFSDDPLRMMRAIRFASELGYSIEENTWNGIIQMAGRIKIISQERITDELNKIILSPQPSVGLDLLYLSGLLKIIFPSMIELVGAEYVDGQGHKDNFYHTLKVLDNISLNTNDLWLRWSAVLHDIAKPVTKKFEEGHGWTFHGHEVVGGRMVPKIFARLKLPLHDEMRFVKKMVELHLRPISLTKENITDSAIRRLIFDAGDDLESLMILCDADITSKNKQKVKRFQENFQFVRQRCREVEENDHIRNWQPPVDGEMIMKMFGLSPGKPIGILKDALKDAILDGVIANSKEAALEFIIERAAEMGLELKKP